MKRLSISKQENPNVLRRGFLQPWSLTVAPHYLKTHQFYTFMLRQLLQGFMPYFNITVVGFRASILMQTAVVSIFYKLDAYKHIYPLSRPHALRPAAYLDLPKQMCPSPKSIKSNWARVRIPVRSAHSYHTNNYLLRAALGFKRHARLR
eukprot:TRINITY_DN2630_c0_g1_i1.p1 TRINITY_DN2630_c0_g1~~TRINITY_DN2630_c0_g1_i1.p1  ORF type:complete len:149 (+),score=13.04 TRINITY_DN2630_c0_g1_i1:127-573(+)